MNRTVTADEADALAGRGEARVLERRTNPDGSVECTIQTQEPEAEPKAAPAPKAKPKTPPVVDEDEED